MNEESDTGPAQDLEDGALDPDEAPSDTEPWDEGADDETGEEWDEEEEDD